MFLRFRCTRHFVINVINNIRTRFIISFHVICAVIYCSFCCIYVWLDPGTYMIARFMSFYKSGVTPVLIQVRPNLWFGWPHFVASGHRLSLGHCLVGPDVRWSVPGIGWSVWSVWWASFTCLRRTRYFVTSSAYSSCFLLIPDLCSWKHKFSKTTMELG